jgi:flagellar motor switch/type III secretory pathway protein FliN
MDAPVVVHLELGSVSLSAQSWLGLRVGDVVCSELPVGKPVTLRVAERAVAEGELVTVDGHVGVRVQRFFKG